MKDTDKIFKAVEDLAVKAGNANQPFEALKLAEAAQRLAQGYCQIIETHVHLEFHLNYQGGAQEEDFPLPGEIPPKQ